jgi:hypothetical protein
MPKETVSTQPVAPASATDKPSGQPVPETPKEPTISVEEIRKIAREESLRASQSLTDKAEDRIKKHLETLHAANVKVTPDQEQGLRSTITKEVMDEARSGLASSQPAPASDNPVMQFVSGIMTEEGVQIEDADPELGDVTKALSDPKATQHSIHKAMTKAIDTKRERLSASNEKANLRVPGVGGTSVSSDDISGITDSATLYEMGEERIRKGKK